MPGSALNSSFATLICRKGKRGGRYEEEEEEEEVLLTVYNE
jgi:hypothetical protein